MVLVSATIVAASAWQRNDSGTLSEANVSGTTFTFVLNPQVEPVTEGNRLAIFNIPSKDNPVLQVVGGEGLTINLTGEFHNTSTKTNSAFADLQCIIWAFKNNIDLTLTLSDGDSHSDMIISTYTKTRVGTVKGGYVYSIVFTKKAT